MVENDDDNEGNEGNAYGGGCMAYGGAGPGTLRFLDHRLCGVVGRWDVGAVGVAWGRTLI